MEGDDDNDNDDEIVNDNNVKDEKVSGDIHDDSDDGSEDILDLLYGDETVNDDELDRHDNTYYHGTDPCEKDNLGGGKIVCLLGIKLWVRRHPDALTNDRTDYWDLPPLHEACNNSHVTKSALLWLIDKCPEAASIEDEHKNLPLHYLLKGSKTVRTPVLLRLMEVHPEGVETQNDHGELPLHLACYNDCASNKIIRILAEHNRKACSKKDNKGNLPLHCLCRNLSQSRLRSIKLLAGVYPGALLERSGQGHLPLEEAMGYDLKCDQLLADLAPESLGSQDKNGCLPLHKACRWGMDYDTVELYLDRYPLGAGRRNLLGQLPLHCLCICCGARPLNIETTQLLIDKYPQALLALDSKGRLPLECYCIQDRTAWKKVAESLQFLLTRSHKAIRGKDRLGKLSLHRLCQLGSRSVPLQALKAVLAAYPECAQIPDRLGNVPLFYLCEQEKKLHDADRSDESSLDESYGMSSNKLNDLKGLNAIYYLASISLPFLVLWRDNSPSTKDIDDKKNNKEQPKMKKIISLKRNANEERNDHDGDYGPQIRDTVRPSKHQKKNDAVDAKNSASALASVDLLAHSENDDILENQ